MLAHRHLKGEASCGVAVLLQKEVYIGVGLQIWSPLDTMRGSFPVLMPGRSCTGRPPRNLGDQHQAAVETTMICAFSYFELRNIIETL
uniref:Uncharacterized protein n=1 Tax=Physcomitrium patens TaxID=3218 RepID=A0A2K1IXM0_PHYPA|nr:hypothetical protein PHYPA_023832 [Physcomitrium patens]